MTFTILTAVCVIGITGLLLGALIAYTAKKFAVESDPRIEEVQALLPGANCGGCGFAGCADMADAIVTKGASPSLCTACTEKDLKSIAEVLGISVDAQEKKVAVVFCSGTVSRAARKAQYNGVMDCRSASRVAGGGGKACRFGCIGYGSCARACPFGAIEVRDGLAMVHPDICRGCGKCEDVCPRKLIRLVPVSAQVHVYCNSLDKPAVKRKNCSSACLACRKCERLDPDHFNAQDQMVRVKYGNPPDPEIVEKVKCPTGALQSVCAHLQNVPESKEETVKQEKV
ncbi:MAG: RnfABCDGE type electron transport complex subunit B [Lentisphaeria bacterium]|nr:RnfABCDGE type electron transport complex subunit B [Lentisphaeria bacterium]